MKLQELLDKNYFNLNESYNDGLYHISRKDDLTISNVTFLEIRGGVMPLKPVGGLWLAKGLSWLRWMKAEDFVTKKVLNKMTVYRVRLKPGAKILSITKDYIKKHGQKNSQFPSHLDLNFEKLNKQYDGFQVYNVKSGGFELFGLSLYDVPTVLVGNKDIIQSIEKIGPVSTVRTK